MKSVTLGLMLGAATIVAVLSSLPFAGADAADIHVRIARGIAADDAGNASRNDANDAADA